jgi:8-oxo-dGTP diphosphatase
VSLWFGWSLRVQEHPESARNTAPEDQNCLEVSAGLVFRHGKLLITQRYADSHLGGLWEFPGGKRESGESFEECLIRELREELGIEIQVGRVLEDLTHFYPEKTVHLRFFQCQWEAREPQAVGCPAFRWVTASELKDYECPAADARLIQRLQTAPELWT